MKYYFACLKLTGTMEWVLASSDDPSPEPFQLDLQYSAISNSFTLERMAQSWVEMLNVHMFGITPPTVPLTPEQEAQSEALRKFNASKGGRSERGTWNQSTEHVNEVL